MNQLAYRKSFVVGAVAIGAIAGVAIGSFASAFTTFLMLRSPDGLRRAFNWLLGGYTGGGWEPFQIILPYLVIGLVVVEQVVGVERDQPSVRVHDVDAGLLDRAHVEGVRVDPPGKRIAPLRSRSMRGGARAGRRGTLRGIARPRAS